MKKNMLIALLGLTIVFGAAMLIGCDDDGAPSCSSLCEKIRDCPDDNGDDIDEQINECLEMCTNLKATLQSGVFEDMANCAEDSMCSEEDTEEACFTAAAAQCKPSDAATTFLTAMCTKMVECDPDQTPDVASCMSMMTESPIVYCLKTSVYEQTTACLSNSTCETAESCLEGLAGFAESATDNMD